MEKLADQAVVGQAVGDQTAIDQAVIDQAVVDQAVVDQTFEDRAKGCFIGALIGDAIGAVLEFQDTVSEKDAEHALKLPGGGPFKVGKGQVTDDSELALCLGHGLVEGQGKLDLDKVAKWYNEWYKSHPFDCGFTIGAAVNSITDDKSNFAKQMREGAERSSSSQSNGGLMRITPLCIWCSKLPEEDLVRCVREETRLTHSNQTALDVSVAYVYTIQHLLNNGGKYKEAYEKCKEIVDKLKNPELYSWVKDVEEDLLPPADTKIGWVRIAFCHALYYLKNNKDYLEAMKEMVSKGGDTDTNCCIVGGMLGALHGYNKLPQDLVQILRDFDNQNGRRRPDFLIPGKNVDKILKGIIDNIPTRAEIIGGEQK